MKVDDKIKIVDALVEIKLALGEYNKELDNRPNIADGDYTQLSKAFLAVKKITEIIKIT